MCEYLDNTFFNLFISILKKKKNKNKNKNENKRI